MTMNWCEECGELEEGRQTNDGFYCHDCIQDNL